MTIGDRLLYWMTHVTEGSWSGFLRTLAALTATEESTPITHGEMRMRLAQYSYAEFFVGGTTRWRMFAPLLGGLGTTASSVLCGGRTPRLVAELSRACGLAGAVLERDNTLGGPNRLTVRGSQRIVRKVASDVGLRFVPNLSMALCAGLPAITQVLEAAPPAAPPLNWSLRSFDFESMRWTDGLLPNTAYEYRSRHGGLRHFVHGPSGVLLQVDRPTAVYAAAMRQGLPIVTYDPVASALQVPRATPLPDAVARALAACSTCPPATDTTYRAYLGVPPAVARVAMVALGQRPPEPLWSN